ncbi:MAG: pilus assembly protein HicB [Humibacillus sp.]|nr:pilus assembly protein HicB [Humibacillus sp.]
MHMDITPYVDALRHDLTQAARAMGPETEQAAERIGFALDSSARLALMDALSHAAAQITTELDGVSVEVRLQGREPVFVVLGAGPGAAAEPPPGLGTSVGSVGSVVGEDATGAADESGDTSRITLRLSEALKARAEELAAARGQSLNTWIVGAVRAATKPGAGTAAPQGPGAPGRNRSSNKRVQGWVR